MSGAEGDWIAPWFGACASLAAWIAWAYLATRPTPLETDQHDMEVAP